MRSVTRLSLAAALLAGGLAAFLAVPGPEAAARAVLERPPSARPSPGRAAPAAAGAPRADERPGRVGDRPDLPRESVGTGAAAAPRLGTLRVRVELAERESARGASSDAGPWTSPLTVALREHGSASLSLQSAEVSIGETARFDGLRPGWVRVSVEQRVADAVRIAAGETRLLVLELPPGLAVSGRVVDREGRGVEGASVRLSIEPTDPESAMVVATSGPGGAFRLAAVVPGSAISAHSRRHQSSPLHVLSGEPGDATQATLTLGAPTSALPGRAVDTAGRGIAGALVFAGVRLDDQLGMPAAETLEGVDPPSTAVTDPDGRFELLGLAPDRDHPVWVGKRGFAVTRVMARPRPPRGGSARAAPGRDELVVELLPEAAVEGVVTHADGHPAEGAYLWCISRRFTPEGSRFSGPSWAADFSESDAEGAFAIRSLHPGPSLLRARLGGELCDLPVQLESGDTLEVRVVLRAGGVRGDPSRTLPGVVEDASGSGVPAARVVVTSRGGERSVAVSDERGSFELRDAPLDASILEVYDGRTSWPFPAVASEGASLWPWLQVRLPYAGLALGLRGQLPRGVERVRLELSREALVHRIEARVPADAPGAFATGPLPPGVYALRAELAGAGGLDLGTVELEPDRFLDLGHLVATQSGRLEVTADRPEGSGPIHVYLAASGAGPQRALVLEAGAGESGAGAFEELPAGTYTLAVWDPRFAVESRTVEIEAGATASVELSPREGQEVRFDFEDRGEPLSMLRFVWKEEPGGATVWDMGMLPWTRAGLESFSARFLPGSYRLEVFDATGAVSSASFRVDPAAPGTVVDVAAGGDASGSDASAP